MYFLEMMKTQSLLFRNSDSALIVSFQVKLNKGGVIITIRQDQTWLFSYYLCCKFEIT